MSALAKETTVPCGPLGLGHRPALLCGTLFLMVGLIAGLALLPAWLGRFGLLGYIST